MKTGRWMGQAFIHTRLTLNSTTFNMFSLHTNTQYPPITYNQLRFLCMTVLVKILITVVMTAVTECFFCY